MNSESIDVKAVAACLKKNKKVFMCNNRPVCMVCHQLGRITIIKPKGNSEIFKCPDCNNEGKKDN